MIVHLGGDVVVSVSHIVAVLDARDISRANNAAFYKCARQNGQLVLIGTGEPSAYVLCRAHGKTRLYASPISSQTLWKRLGQTHGGVAGL